MQNVKLKMQNILLCNNLTSKVTKPNRQKRVDSFSKVFNTFFANNIKFKNVKAEKKNQVDNIQILSQLKKLKDQLERLLKAGLVNINFIPQQFINILPRVEGLEMLKDVSNPDSKLEKLLLILDNQINQIKKKIELVNRISSPGKSIGKNDNEKVLENSKRFFEPKLTELLVELTESVDELLLELDKSGNKFEALIMEPGNSSDRFEDLLLTKSTELADRFTELLVKSTEPVNKLEDLIIDKGSNQNLKLVDNIKQIGMADLIRAEFFEPNPKSTVNNIVIIDDIITKLKLALDTQKTEINFILKPENLGRLNMRITINDDGMVVAKFVVENHNVGDLLKSNINLLKDTFANLGYSIKEFDIFVTDDRSFQDKNWNYAKNYNNKNYNLAEEYNGRDLSYYGEFFQEAEVNITV